MSDCSSDVCSSDLAPHMALGPHGQLEQLMDGGMIVTADLIGQRQVEGIENAGFGTEELQQARGFLDAQARIGALTQGDRKSVEEGKGVAVSGDFGGRGTYEKKK